MLFELIVSLIIALLFGRRNVKEIEEKIIDEMNTVFCRTEKIGEMIYVWELKTGKFLIQSKSMQEIIEFFVEKYPGQRVLFTENPNDKKTRIQSN